MKGIMSKKSKKSKVKPTKTSSKLPQKIGIIFRKYRPLLVVVSMLVVGAVLFWPISSSENVERKIEFSTKNTDSAEYELGEVIVSQDGVSGKKAVTYSVKTNIFSILLGIDGHREEVSSKVVASPTEKIVVSGTRKYQYMLCSDGSYRYYTDEQFKDPNTGFTSKSEDSCAKSNQGVKLKLADDAKGGVRQSSVAQNNTPTANLPTDSSCKKINIVKYKTVTTNDPSMSKGARQVMRNGSDGYTFSCPRINVNNVIQPVDELVYIGTGENAAAQAAEQARLEQEAALREQHNNWLACSQSVRSQVAAINGGDPTAAIRQLCGRSPY